MIHARNTTQRLFIEVVWVSLIAVCPHAANAEAPKPLGIAMETWDYPHEVHYLPLTIQGHDVRMAYMDVSPVSFGAEANGRSVVLMHGKNFFGAYWEDTIKALAESGYRVVAPDQVGFGKSSKPNLHYSFHLLASNTKKLLDELSVEKTAVVGHSMGGMLATRFALMHPETTTHLILENPIGLEDYRLQVPWTPTEKIYKSILDKTEEGIRRDFQSYFVQWKPEYERFVEVHYRWTLSGEYPRLAWASALTAQMIYEQPVVHELEQLKVPSLLVIGQEDRTALGKSRASGDAAARLGQYPQLGRRAAKQIPTAQLVELKGVRHIPHLEAQEEFHEALLEFLNKAL
ncbi:MAG: alpha/beta hydrolase [Planctomycetes bacterium]|nr:alpha/beta hydrolase [Planctomycetota bacterium]